MGQTINDLEQRAFRDPYVFVLLLLCILGAAFIALGATMFSPMSIGNQMLVGFGISLAPAAVVAALFRYFLLSEIRLQLTKPLMELIEEDLGPRILTDMRSVIEEYRAEVEALRACKEAGVRRPYRRREDTLRKFAAAIEAEASDVVVVGSSLKGLLHDKVFEPARVQLQRKIQDPSARVRFLLTHPAVADLRASQEGRRFGDIGMEIIETLKLLSDWGVPPEDVRLYKGTPTCFGIKTTTEMLLNPYPYGQVAYDSPCLIVGQGYFYRAFQRTHFGAWDTGSAEAVVSYESTIASLEKRLEDYTGCVEQLLKA